MSRSAGSSPVVMPHGYTHRTTRLGSVITKAYRGPWARAGCARETAALTALAGVLPVPRVIAAGPDWLQTELMPGVHGQDLIAAGLARPVLAACGRLLRQLHAVPIPPVLRETVLREAVLGEPVLRETVLKETVLGETVLSDAAPSDTAVVLVHGDFGPNNVLLDERAEAVTAVLDWEWSQAGDPIEDLAWTEFIMRLHDPADVSALDDFYAGYGTRAPWPRVQQTILRRCESLLELCQSWRPDGPYARAWAERIEIARSWTE
jgi:aminoglycoside phosphotransferase (APT) family kinase protein